ncbi:Protein ENHANCED DOWNY MILDEW 2 [Linum grandiflorum]
MSSSDDEGDAGPKSVSEYHFEDDEQEPISFSVLPVKWSDDDDSRPGNGKGGVQQIFLRGAADRGLQTVFKPVKAWKFDLSNAFAEISVLTKDNSWIKLLKPRKSFEAMIRTTLVTVQFLHLVKRSPDSSGKPIWDNLSKTFSTYEVRPSQDDLIDHMDLIREAVSRDASLKKCKLLLSFLEEKPRKKTMADKDKQTVKMSGFLVDDADEGIFEASDEEDDSNDDLFDSVCAFCDNGGEILCCEGKCMRAFHATKDDGEESFCESLGLSKKKVDEMQNFVCKNCEYEQHQCFACGDLGCSKKSSDAEVFRCANATCGYFYHPHCVAKWLHPGDKVAAEELEKKIASRESFLCPIHKCCHCNQGENKQIPDLQFAVCRRCPTAYHSKCLPKEIHIAKDEDEADGGEEEDDIVDRGWKNLLPNRILLYCLKHEIESDLGTPVRDHIKFPGSEVKRSTIEEKMSKSKTLLEKQTTIADSSSGKIASKGRTLNSLSPRQHESIDKGKKKLSSSYSFKSAGTGDSAMSFPRERKKVVPPKIDGSAASGRKKSSLGDKLFDLMNTSSGENLAKQERNESRVKRASSNTNAQKKPAGVDLPELDADSERRLLALIKSASSSVSMADIVNKYKAPSTHVYSSRTAVDKTITLGKVEGAVEAVRTAAKKLENNCSIEDAKAVCEPGVLGQIFKWKNKLRVYLAPFLHGMRYTSFGRHFTKPEKLAEIVNKLHWYVESGDMIVDFCCGANDFSWQMKNKLEEMGKKCSYKNYDLFRPKNAFNFEKRDWMTVKPHELRKQGSNLIMGLNPPFGVRASLANKFIDKALEFKPKLIILVVPPETQRLDDKNPPYDLVWEDYESLGGKSFYLPGSVDDTDKIMDQWNATAPVLYLWSRHDFTKAHKAIAEKRGHVVSRQEGSRDITMRQEFITEVQDLYNEGSVLIGNPGMNFKQSERSADREAGGEDHMESFHSESSETKKLRETNSNKRRHDEQKSERVASERSTVETHGSQGLVKESEKNSNKMQHFEQKLERLASENSRGEAQGSASGGLEKKESEKNSNKRKYEVQNLERGASDKSSGDSQKGKKLPRRSTPIPSPSETRGSGNQYRDHESAGDVGNLDTGFQVMRYPKLSGTYSESSARASDDTSACGQKDEPHGKFPERPSLAETGETNRRHNNDAGYGEIRHRQHSDTRYPPSGSYAELSARVAYDAQKIERTVEDQLGPRNAPERPSSQGTAYQYRGQDAATTMYAHHTPAYGGNLDDISRRHGFDTEYQDTRNRQRPDAYFESSAQASFGTSSSVSDRYMQQSYGTGGSVMDRYAPLLHELNQQPLHQLNQCFGYEHGMNGGGGGYDSRQHPGSVGFQVDQPNLLPPHGPPHPGSGFGGGPIGQQPQPGSGFAMGFAPGPQQPHYGHNHNSAGWMND